MCVCVNTWCQWNRTENSETEAHNVEAGMWKRYVKRDTGKCQPWHKLTLLNFMFEITLNNKNMQSFLILTQEYVYCLCRARRRERENVREKHWFQKHQSLAFCIYLNQVSNPQQRCVLWLGAKPRNLWGMGWHSDQLSHRPGLYIQFLAKKLPGILLHKNSISFGYDNHYLELTIKWISSPLNLETNIKMVFSWFCIFLKIYFIDYYSCPNTPPFPPPPVPPLPPAISPLVHVHGSCI